MASSQAAFLPYYGEGLSAARSGLGVRRPGGAGVDELILLVAPGHDVVDPGDADVLRRCVDGAAGGELDAIGDGDGHGRFVFVTIDARGGEGLHLAAVLAVAKEGLLADAVAREAHEPAAVGRALVGSELLGAADVSIGGCSAHRRQGGG
jgi:hypothetical protein